jgi:lipopolysaccharide transport system ATP-binding protein
MIVRLAFSVAIHVDPEILLVDEALAVGDIYFRQRCMRKVHELRARGITILFVSHATGDVKALGDRAMWLRNGEIVELGETDRVVTKYLAAMAQKDSAYQAYAVAPLTVAKGNFEAPEITENLPNVDHRFGDGRAEVMGIQILDAALEPTGSLEPRSTIVVRISVRAKESLASPIVGFMMRNHLGVDFAGTNTARENYPLTPMGPGDIFTVDFHLDIPELYATTFSFSPAIANGTLDQYSICDWIDNAIALHMSPADSPIYGYLNLKCRVSVNQRLTASVSPVVAGE